MGSSRESDLSIYKTTQPVSPERTATSFKGERPSGNNADLPRNQSAIHQFELDTENLLTEQKPRGKWGFNIEFILAAVGFSVVYRQIWTFPYLMQRYGVVVFLLPYVCFYLLLGVPMFYLETCLGQFWGKGPFHAWKFCPLLRGIGMSMVIANIISYVYSAPFTSWFLYYAAISFSDVIPWTTCDNAWNTDLCATNASYSFYYATNFVHPAREYFFNEFLKISPGIDDLGSMRWELVGCMAAVTVLIFGALFWGVRLTGKVYNWDIEKWRSSSRSIQYLGANDNVTGGNHCYLEILYVTVLLPLVIMFILFIRGVTLPGGKEGIINLLYPNYELLNGFEIWEAAFTDVFFTVSISQGVVLTLASYNGFKAPCFRFSFIVCGIVISIGVMAGLMLTSLQGASGIKDSDAGPDLVFITCAGLLATLPAAKFWCFIFFCMYLLLSLTQQIVYAEVTIRTIMDIIPRPNHFKRILVVGGFCLVFLILTLPFLTQGGSYLITLLDIYTWKMTTPGICVLECISVVWIYGLDRFSEDVKMMRGLRPSIVYKFLWAFLIPGVYISMSIYWETKHEPAVYDNYVYPDYANSLGYFIAALPLFPVVIFAVIKLLRCRNMSAMDPDTDCKPDTDRWSEYDANQRQMKGSFIGNLKAIFKT